MNSRPADSELLTWVKSVLTESEACSLSAVAGDASARRYFRLALGQRTFIAVEAPPASEKNTEFLAVRQTLEKAGVRVPTCYAADLTRGFMLLEDLGNRLLLDELTPDTVDRHYLATFDVLQRIAAADVPAAGWPRYDRALLTEELSRFPYWFVDQMLGACPAPEAAWQSLLELLLQNALGQPQVLVHRDFHSRNLMLQADGEMGVIDFQDAVLGPATYDLVSLLRDCYVRWTPEQVRDWALAYQQQSVVLQDVPAAVFLRWFDLMGLQRHLKVLGTFARLSLRDAKSTYLSDLPLVLRYVREVLVQVRDESDDLAAFAAWFESDLMAAVRSQAWGRSL